MARRSILLAVPILVVPCGVGTGGDAAWRGAPILPGPPGFFRLQGPGPPRPADGPWNHQVHFAVSQDGLTWRERREPILTQASVPDVVELTKTSQAGLSAALLVYAVYAPGGPGDDGIARLASNDGGKTWSGPERIVIDGGPPGGKAVDPSIVELEDGRLRLYVFAMASGPWGGPPRIYSAVSADGLHFELEKGVRYEQPAPMTDPEVIRSGDGWLMLLATRGGVFLTRSTDGQIFIRDRRFWLPDGGIPGALALEDGTVRVYGNDRRGIVSYVCDPDRGDITADAGVRLAPPAADPSVCRLQDGSYVMVLKRWMKPAGPTP